MDYQIKLTKRANKVIDKFISEWGTHTRAEALNFIIAVSYKYYQDQSILFKPRYKDYTGEINFHYRGWSKVADIMSEFKIKGQTQSEFINLMIEVFNHGWYKGKG